MKTIIISTIAVLLAVFINGCAFYGSEHQYDQGKWKGWAGSEEVARTKADKLAFAKLASAPVQTLVTNGVVQGYEGLIANLSKYQRYNFKLFGPETKSYLLGPGERKVDYLIPGEYACVIFKGGAKVGQWTFRVNAQQSTFMNETYHWYVYADR